jgi:hypothetical protein
MENNSNEPQKPKNIPAVALFLGFTPSVILLAVFSGVGRTVSGDEEVILLWLACIASLACCLVSSALLFRRGTGGAIAGAFLLLCLNGFIAFFFGCCATVRF